MSELRVGQKVFLWGGNLPPFKAVVMERGIKVLEDVRFVGSNRVAMRTGYLMFRIGAPDKLVRRLESGGWNYKLLIEMEENE